jgi:hypothetical protein
LPTLASLLDIHCQIDSNDAMISAGVNGLSGWIGWIGWLVVSGSSGAIGATGISLADALAMLLSKASPVITPRAGLFTESHGF